ncbi:hypothetical protein SARC_12209 [Sphaeroforma arctica JP610]|uniref:DNL-type domain-containing protein n=1 Tax=Sphaeroforma arctica JP610 TaxID=667725 RepID=A0A0L0FGU3_9EUKA|nr:hypothetical protein SARC_12209 [Sphaeroforma arctica JP610]KNC75263.1 hypothetical protein SARC_12209 [Sphaeroforma arctica JP610]|eukprot:XP_014149165.1 hypothetical protein SARC_12209 [Sphaeroforma arctica JP610]
MLFTNVLRQQVGPLVRQSASKSSPRCHVQELSPIPERIWQSHTLNLSTFATTPGICRGATPVAPTPTMANKRQTVSQMLYHNAQKFKNAKPRVRELILENRGPCRRVGGSFEILTQYHASTALKSNMSMPQGLYAGSYGNGKRWYCKANDRSGTAVSVGEGSAQSLGKIEARLQIQFTCGQCKERVTKDFSKHSYEKGVVIITCPGCSNRHLIADNLGWFADVEGRNIEEIMANKGQKVQRLTSKIQFDTLEVDPEDTEKIKEMQTILMGTDPTDDPINTETVSKKEGKDE